MGRDRLFDPMVLFGALLVIVWGMVAVVGIFPRAGRRESFTNDDLPDRGSGGELTPDSSNDMSPGVEKDSFTTEAQSDQFPR